jgi:hypothetical protein
LLRSIHLIRADIETEVFKYKMKVSLKCEKIGIINNDVEYRMVA